MERPISSLAFKGSIAEAIVEAKRQKNLFVVYISGDNPESIQLEKSTWMDLSVAESLSKYCILLHISEGSSYAAQFSAIYPQKSVPCITAIGYNGVQLWRNEGFVTGEVLASSLEKAWLSLHIQETTATFLTAALTSKKSEQFSSGASGSALLEQGSSSESDVRPPSTDKHVHSLEAEYPEIVEENKHSEDAVDDINSRLGNEVSPASVFASELGSGGVEQTALSTETMQESLNHAKIELKNIGAGHMPLSVEDRCPASENLNVADQHSGIKAEAAQVIPNEASEAVQEKKDETIEIEKADVLEFSRSKSNDVYINIRLPDGASLQKKFSMMSTLRMVKDYVDKNQESGVGPYDLAIPYPRKVFNDQDLTKTLSELGLFNRQALIVVPHHRALGHHKGGSSLRNQTTSTSDIGSSNGSGEGYLSFMKRIITYMNPLSYLGGGASSSGSMQESQSSMWQYSPNPTLQNNLSGTGKPYVESANQNPPATGRNNGNSRQQTSSRFGSNIHTLKHDEDDSRFSDKNAYWNGNSTQYGGDNDGK